MKDALGHGSDGRGATPFDRSRIGMTADARFSGKALRGVGDKSDTSRTVARIREQLQGLRPQSGHGAGLLQALKNFGGTPTSADKRRAFVGQFGNTGGSMASRMAGPRTFGRR